MLSEIGKLYLAEFMRENFVGTFRYNFEKGEMKSKFLLGVDIDTKYICLAMVDAESCNILAHKEYKTISILAQPIIRKEIDTYKKEIVDYCKAYMQEVYEHYIKSYKASQGIVEFNQETKQEILERLNKHIKEM